VMPFYTGLTKGSGSGHRIDYNAVCKNVRGLRLKLSSCSTPCRFS
jgi:hypothetical protein